MTDTRLAYGACNLCEAVCGLEFHVSDKRILAVRPDAADPLSRGHICPKAVALKDIHEDPDRLRQPMLRGDDGQWREAGWDEALDRVAERLTLVHENHGPDAIGVYMGNPSVHNYGTMTHAQHFLSHLHTRNRYSATSCDQLPHQLVGLWLYGHQLMVPIPDIDHSRYFLVLGANPMASNGSLMTVPDFRKRLKALQARGGKMVVLDPRRSETAQVADAHHFIQPGTDAAFLIALLQKLISDPRCDSGHLTPFIDGRDAVLEGLRALDAEQLRATCGLSEDTINGIAEDFLSAGAAVCYGRMGVSTQQHGTLCQWLIQLINVLSGNLDRVGGAMFTAPAVDMLDGPASRPGHYGRWHSRVRGLPEFGGELPAVAMTEEMQTPGPGQVRAFITIAGNPVLSTPGGRELDAALKDLDFMVSIDPYLNETTRHAHVILPPTCGVEHDHYDLIFNVFAVRNTAKYSPGIVERPAGALHDWEIFTALGKRLAALLGTTVRPDMRPDQFIDLGLQMGPYGAGKGHAAALSLEKLKANPHGVDLGPLQPCLPQRLLNTEGRIRLAVPQMLEALAGYAQSLTETAVDGDLPLRLIGRRHVRSNNSWMHNSRRLTKGPTRHELLMHPQDLSARGIVDGARVSIRSRVGSVEVEVLASEEMMQGVVSLPHGWGHGVAGTRMEIANRQPGVNANQLTDPARVDSAGNAALNGVPVDVQAV